MRARHRPRQRGGGVLGALLAEPPGKAGLGVGLGGAGGGRGWSLCGRGLSVCGRGAGWGPGRGLPERDLIGWVLGLGRGLSGRGQGGAEWQAWGLREREGAGEGGPVVSVSL